MNINSIGYSGNRRSSEIIVGDQENGMSVIVWHHLRHVNQEGDSPLIFSGLTIAALSAEDQEQEGRAGIQL